MVIFLEPNKAAQYGDGKHMRVGWEVSPFLTHLLITVHANASVTHNMLCQINGLSSSMYAIAQHNMLARISWIPKLGKTGVCAP